jgi:hypothetical protein
MMTSEIQIKTQNKRNVHEHESKENLGASLQSSKTEAIYKLIAFLTGCRRALALDTGSSSHESTSGGTTCHQLLLLFV